MNEIREQMLCELYIKHQTQSSHINELYIKYDWKEPVNTPFGGGVENTKIRLLLNTKC